MTPIYLDHAASTPPDPAVLAAMVGVLQGPLGVGNPSSVTHVPGRDAAAAIEHARGDVAALVGAEARDIIFTSGATEADNLAILGIARGRAAYGRHLVTARTEHKAVLDPCRQLEKQGWQVSWLEPAADGRLDPAAVAAALRPDTQLVSVMHANNETGVVQDIAAIAAVCRRHEVLLHCDAAQSAARLPVEVDALGIDLLSLSAHKLYGPKGVGALWASPRARPWIEPLMWGGGHERALRPGTLATHQLVGFGVAAAIARQRRQIDAAQVEEWVARFRAALQGLEALRWNDHLQHRLPGLVSLSIAGVEGESLLAALPEIAVSTGAACDSASAEPSYVLRAQGISAELAQATLRICFGRHNSARDAETAGAAVVRAVRMLRARNAPGMPAAVAPGERWHEGAAGTLREGAQIRCYLKVRPDGRIGELVFRAATCPAVWRVLEALQQEAPGRPVSEPAVGGPRDWAHRHSVPIEKLGRLLRVEDALRAALAARHAGDS